MYSTTDNLANPLQTGPIHVPFERQITDPLTVEYVTQEFYNRITIKDPATAYVIKDSKEPRVYIGTVLLNQVREEVRYLMGSQHPNGGYPIYMCIRTPQYDRIVQIATYEKPQDALDALTRFNRVDSHNNLLLDTRTSILYFIQEPITVHDFIIGLIALFGYRDDPMLQSLNTNMRAYGAADEVKDIGTYARMMLKRLRDTKANYLYRFYASLYDLLEEYEFFRSKKYTKDPEGVDLSHAIRKIASIMVDTTLPED